MSIILMFRVGFAMMHTYQSGRGIYQHNKIKSRQNISTSLFGLNSQPSVFVCLFWLWHSVTTSALLNAGTGALVQQAQQRLPSQYWHEKGAIFGGSSVQSGTTCPYLGTPEPGVDKRQVCGCGGGGKN